MGVLHRDVSRLRTELGRYSGAVVTPASQTGNGRGNVRVVETVEAEEDEEINGDGRVTEVSDTIAVYHRTCIALRVLYNVYYITKRVILTDKDLFYEQLFVRRARFSMYNRSVGQSVN